MSMNILGTHMPNLRLRRDVEISDEDEELFQKLTEELQIVGVPAPVVVRRQRLYRIRSESDIGEEYLKLQEQQSVAAGEQNLLAIAIPQHVGHFTYPSLSDLTEAGNAGDTNIKQTQDDDMLEFVRCIEKRALEMTKSQQSKRRGKKKNSTATVNVTLPATTDSIEKDQVGHARSWQSGIRTSKRSRYGLTRGQTRNSDRALYAKSSKCASVRSGSQTAANRRKKLKKKNPGLKESEEEGGGGEDVIVEEEEEELDWDDERVLQAQDLYPVDFNEAPAKKPNCLCFDYPGMDLTHRDIRQAIERVMPEAFTKKLVASLRFENRRFKHQMKTLMNRWHIEFSNVRTRNTFLKSGLTFITEETRQKIPVKLRKYDQVAGHEYKRYLESINASHLLNQYVLENM